MAVLESNDRRRLDLALLEVEALAVNLIHDCDALEAKACAVAPGVAVLLHADLAILRTGAECCRAEACEARRGNR
jgi:hypothetical protein